MTRSAPWPDDDDDPFERQLRECVEHVEQHRTAAQRVQHLGRRRAHAGAFARGEHHGAQRSVAAHCVTPSRPSLSFGRSVRGWLGGEVSNLDLGLQRTPCCRYTTPERRSTTATAPCGVARTIVPDRDAG